MMVNLGKAQVFKRQMPQALHGLFNIHSSVFDIRQ
jgi:hypothetical protein